MHREVEPPDRPGGVHARFKATAQPERRVTPASAPAPRAPFPVAVAAHPVSPHQQLEPGSRTDGTIGQEPPNTARIGAAYQRIAGGVAVVDASGAHCRFHSRARTLATSAASASLSPQDASQPGSGGACADRSPTLHRASGQATPRIPGPSPHSTSRYRVPLPSWSTVRARITSPSVVDPAACEPRARSPGWCEPL